MAIMNKSGQYLYTGRGPIDAKSLVKTYAELTSDTTWNVDIDGKSTFVAYNGMITAVYLDRDADKNLTDKNGIYFLFDVQASTGAKKPNVTDEANWHKLANAESLVDRLSAIDERLTALEEDSDVLTYGYRSGFPAEGEVNKLYVAADEGKTYIWFNEDYLPVGGGDYEEPTMIYGGDSGI